MTSTELAAIVRGIAPVVREFFANSSAEFVGRIVVLERSLAAVRDGQDGAPGVPGATGEAGAPGRDGVDGTDGGPGQDGAPGAQGPPGEPGAAGQAGEKGVDGIHGRDGMPGRDGLPGLQGEKGLDGRNGVDGVHGKDGADGLGYEDAEEELEDGGRFLIRRYRRGDVVVKEFRHKTAANIYRGVWVSGKTYDAGDSVTWAGSMWIAKETTTARPGEAGEASRAWQLAVKAGRDGRDAKDLPVVAVGRPR